MRSGSRSAICCLRLELELLLGRELVLRRDPDHVARLAHAQALGLQDDVERLVPGHVLQAQRDAAGDGVAGHDVEVGEVGDDLQQRAHFDVLEVQRQLLARVARALRQLVRVDLLRPHFEHELVVALVGAVLPRRRAARSTMRTRSPLCVRGDASAPACRSRSRRAGGAGCRAASSAGTRPPGSGLAGGCRRRPGCWAGRRRRGRRRRRRGGSRCPSAAAARGSGSRQSEPAAPVATGAAPGRRGPMPVEHDQQRLALRAAAL